MPRKTKNKKPGIRKYWEISNYSKATLQEALDKIKTGAMSQRTACKTYKIPRSTICNKLKKKHSKAVGRPICLTMEEEITFRDHLLTLSDMGIPVGLQDFKDIIKKYLDSIGKVIPVFKDNSPGYEWAKLYLERHPALKQKIAHNISRKRAQVNEEMVNEFFDRLEKEIEGVSPDNIYNMDESGFHDNPGKKKLLFRRSTRHPELVRNSTKSCYTIVFAGNAVGELIPPFFIFKGKHCWSDWLHNAPKSSKMAVSKSGWIDAEIFEEWLKNHFVPIVDKKEGKKVLICDNLSAHISIKALKICEEHNIKFICLIPNSTHLLQPLDVGYFASLKSTWRSVLNKWRQTQRGRKAVSLPKNFFCQLVKAALEMNESTAGLNLITGFRKCGIYPLSRKEVLQTLPGYATGQIQETVGESFKEYLKEIRESDLNVKKCKKFQLPVQAGKAVSAEEVEMFYKNKENEQKRKEKPAKKGRPKGSTSKNKAAKKKSMEERTETTQQALELDKTAEEWTDDVTLPMGNNLQMLEIVDEVPIPGTQIDLTEESSTCGLNAEVQINQSCSQTMSVEAGKTIAAEKVENFTKYYENENQNRKLQPAVRGRPKSSKNKDSTKKSVKERNETLQKVDLVGKDCKEVTESSKGKRKLAVMETLPTHNKNTTKKKKLDTHQRECDILPEKHFEFVVTTAQIHNYSEKKIQGLEEGVIPKFSQTFKETDLDTIEEWTNEQPIPRANNLLNMHLIDEVPIFETEVEIKDNTEHIIYPETITGEYIVHPQIGRMIKLNDQEEHYDIDKYCVFQDEGTLFPGRIIKICQSPLTLWVSCLRKRFEGGWTWPEKQDVSKITDIKMIKKILRDENVTRNGSTVLIEDDFLSLEWGE